MNFKVTTRDIGEALQAYWQRMYKTQTRLDGNGAFYTLTLVSPKERLMWREICEAFVGGRESALED